jgi:hypothetical protein
MPLLGRDRRRLAIRHLIRRGAVPNRKGFGTEIRRSRISALAVSKLGSRIKAGDRQR